MSAIATKRLSLSSRAGAENSLESLLTRESDFGNESGQIQLGFYSPGQETIDYLKSEANILIIGAGGLGCEILKNLALSGFKNMHVIDMDTIDVTNLNRQFLFRAKDVGKMKSEVAAQFIMKRIPSVTVTPHTCAIQTKDEDFYRQFHLVIAGLDNIEARRWMNSMLHAMVVEDDDGNVDGTTIIPFIDGGSEAFKGQARVIVPRVTSCFECSIESFPPQTQFQLCTVAETPRKPDHCIAYVMFAVNKSLANVESLELRKQWEEKFGKDTNLDKDDPDHMKWLFERASERADVYNIPGVTYMLTMGVVKNIIPAVASTNAIIAAACGNEVLKALSWCSQSLNTYFMYNGTTGVYSHTFEYAKKEGCPVCSPQTHTMEVSDTETLQEFMDKIMADPAHQLKKPSLGKPGKTLFMQAPAPLRKATESNLMKKVSELVEDGEVITVTDPMLPLVNIEFRIRIS